MSVCEFNRRKLFLRAWVILCMLLNAVTSQAVDDGLTTCEIEALVRQLTNPSQEYQLHAAALRNQLRNILDSERLDSLQSLDDSSDDYTDADKRSLSSLARSGFIHPGKRYLGALARSGMLRPELDNIKRSLATLAKNGQLPSQEPDVNDSSQQWDKKRNLGSVAKSGYMTGKRNIGSLARDYQLPSNGKRNLAALARLGFVPSTTPKRTIASLARFNMLPKNSYNNKREVNYWQVVPSLPNDDTGDAAKRNIGALKNSPVHGKRQKRELYPDILNEDNYEIPEQILQTSPLDYEELKDTMDRIYGPYYGDSFREGKRFLGSIARTGWFESRPVDKRNIGSLARLGLLRSEYSGYGSQKARESYRQQEQKRHIGALARSGWLPAFRSVRSGRFSRSGRARSDTTPNKSDFDNPSRPYVDDAMILNYKTQSAGVPPDYIQHGEHHPVLRLYIGEVYDPQEPTLIKSQDYDLEYPVDTDGDNDVNNSTTLNLFDTNDILDHSYN